MAEGKRTARCVTLREAWQELKRVRVSIEDYFSDATEEVRTAATMTALELAENVLKHGADSGSGMVTMAQENGEIVISTQNRVRSAYGAQAVRQRIERIKEKGAREMYVARMLEIMQQPGSGESGLGLLRVAYEGAFQLSCEILGDRLLIQARRRFDALPS
jgi:hypothetical protein